MRQNIIILEKYDWTTVKSIGIYITPEGDKPINMDKRTRFNKKI